MDRISCIMQFLEIPSPGKCFYYCWFWRVYFQLPWLWLDSQVSVLISVSVFLQFWLTLYDLVFLNAIFYNKCEMIRSVKSWSLCFRMVVRILPPANNKCQCELGMKFGCQPKNVVHLLRVARELEVDVVGVRWVVLTINTLTAAVFETMTRQLPAAADIPLRPRQPDSNCSSEESMERGY